MTNRSTPSRRHGDLQQRVPWSPWSLCQSSFSLLLVPSLPGVFVVAEEVIAPGQSAAMGEKRMLAVLKVDTADDLGCALNRLFVAESAIRDRLRQAPCFVRYAVITDAAEREAAREALETWMAGAAPGSSVPADAPADVSQPLTLPLPGL
ncbi:MAG: hypothetical protein ACR2IF_18330 [Terriglobales bacterium]